MARNIEPKHEAIFNELCMFTKNCTVHGNSLNNYIDFKRINECLNQVVDSEDEVSILDYTDPIEFQEIVKKLNKNALYRKYNTKGNSQYSSAVANYQEFLWARKYAKLTKEQGDSVPLENIDSKEYSLDKLGLLLQSMYDNADKGKQVVAIYMFGLTYGGSIIGKYNAQEIISKTTMPSSYEAELSKALRIYKYMRDKKSPILDELSSQTLTAKELSSDEKKEEFRKFCMIDLAESTANNYCVRLATNPVIQYALSKFSDKQDLYEVEDDAIAVKVSEKVIEYNADMRDKNMYVNDLSGKDIKDAPSILKKYCDFLYFIKPGSMPKQETVHNVQQTPFVMDNLIKAIQSTNLIYSDNLIKRLAYSLMTKPFVILSGLAGSGKTQLALTLAKALVEDEEKQMCLVSVGADWTNREPLLGFPNALQPGKYERPESGVLDLLIECNKDENKDKPYFLILDEMNLSYVERYFADFLSAMESHEDIKLWKNHGNTDDETPNDVSLTKNLFIIGTINVDETTYMFSPKVLDRANVIEFEVSEDDMDTFLDAAPNVDIKKCMGLAANMAADFVNIASSNKEMSTVANETLKKFFKNLKAANAEFGYRTATEIGRFISLASEDMTEDEAVDAAIVQKLLPKLHGSRKKIIPVLEELWKLCGCDDLKELESPDASVAKYNLTADKVLRMYNVALDNGFASFAEA